MRPIPKNRIKEDLYTNGTGIGENITLRFKSNKTPYIGFYNIINGNKYSTGKTFDDNSQPLEKYDLLATASSRVANLGSIPTAQFSAGFLLGGAVANITNPLPNNPPSIRYFHKNLGTSDIVIKEINKEAYNELANTNSSNYQVISYNNKTQTLEDVDKQMPGLAAFLTT